MNNISHAMTFLLGDAIKAEAVGHATDPGILRWVVAGAVYKQDFGVVEVQVYND